MKRVIPWVLGFLLLTVGGLALAVERGRVKLEQNLSQLLQSPVHIHRLTLSPSRLTLHQVSLRPLGEGSGGDPQTPALVSVDRLQIQGWFLGRNSSVEVTGLSLSLAGVPLTAQGRVSLTTAPGSVARCEGWLAFEHPFISGRVELSGKVSEPILLGWLEGPEGVRRHFVAQLNVTREAITLSQAQIQGGWWASGTLNFSPRRGVLQLVGLKERFELQIDPLPKAGGRFHAWMRREDQIPQELAARWILRRSYLELSANFLREQVSLNGRIYLTAPYPLDLTLDLRDMEMADLADRIFLRRRSMAISGQMDGQVRLKGPLRCLVSQGEVRGHDAKVGRGELTQAVLRFTGLGPIVKIENSQMTRPSGTVLVEGTVDVRRFGQPDFFKGLHLSSMEKALNLSGWRMSPTPGGFGLWISRNALPKQVAVKLAYEVDQEVQPEPVAREKMEVAYPLSEEERLNIRLDRQEGFLGVEHRKKF